MGIVIEILTFDNQLKEPPTVGKGCWVAGWGKTESVQLSSILNEAGINILPKSYIQEKTTSPTTWIRWTKGSLHFWSIFILLSFALNKA